ncbi:MAG TPA: cation:proton antiporter, partial [Rhodothermales bacterium]
DTLSLIIFTVILGVAEEGSIDVGQMLLVTVRIAAFFAATTVIGLKFFPWAGHRLTEAGMTGRTFNFTLVLLIAVLFGEMAELAGLHAILGAFLAGLFLRENVLGRKLSRSLMDAVQDASIGFLAPIFFVTAGFQVTFDVFQTDLGLFVAIMGVATVGKILGTALFYIPTGNGWREGLVIGAGMNGRGAVEIIVAGIAMEMGLISQEIFSILVFMAIFTTATVPLFLKWGNEWLRSRGELVRRETERSGVVIVGADTLARALGIRLKQTQPVWLIDTNERRCSRAREEGLDVVCGNALQDNILAEAHAPQAATLIAMTSNAEVNMLAGQLAKDEFFIPDIHILPTGGDGVGRETSFRRLGATSLFARTIPVGMWSQWIRTGAIRERTLTIRRQEVKTANDLILHLEQEGRCLAMTVKSENNVHPIHDQTTFRDGDEITYLCYDEEAATRPVAYDRFDRLVELATVVDLPEELSLDDFFSVMAARLSETVAVTAGELGRLLREKERDFSSLIAPGFAVPHVVVDDPDVFHIAIARSRDGITFPAVQERAHALFVIVRSSTERTLHLRVLAAIAQIIQDPNFEARWDAAPDGEALRRILRESDRRRFE